MSSTATWDLYYTDDNVPYYVNSLTNESAWEPPATTLTTPTTPSTPPAVPPRPSSSAAAVQLASARTSSPVTAWAASPSPGKAEGGGGGDLGRCRCRVALGVGVLVAVGVVAVLVATGVVFGSPASDSSTSYALPAPQSGKLMYAVSNSQRRPNGEPRIVARAYGDGPWEPMPDAAFVPFSITCDENNDNCVLAAGGSFTIQTVDVPDAVASASPEVQAARLLAQGGFGASLSEIRRVAAQYGDDAGAWVMDQMRMQRTSARAYQRQRTNPRVDPDKDILQPETAPCDLNTRWHEYALSTRDIGSLLVVTADNANQRFVLSINDTVRATVANFSGEPFPGDAIAFYNDSNTATYVICDVYEGIHSPVELLLPEDGAPRSCDTDEDLLTEPNPTISLTDAAAASLGDALQILQPEDASFLDITTGHLGSRVLEWRGVDCTLDENAHGNAFVRYGDDLYMHFDKRARWWTNTLDEPSAGGPGSDADGACPQVFSTYLNRDHCVRRPTCGDALPAFTSADVLLDTDTLRAWYLDESARRYVYYIDGLRLESPYAVSFCATRSSRWLKHGSSPCTTTTEFLNASTLATVQSALSASTDPNPYVRDIVLTGACNPDDPATIGAFVEAGGVCYEHVHPEHYAVHDATRWVEIHDGNVAAMTGGRPNPIARFAENGHASLVFPWHHPMSRWALRSGNLPYVGRFGDVVSFLDLQDNLRTTAMAVRVGALVEKPAYEVTVACGSPDEVASVPVLGDHYYADSQSERPPYSDHVMPRASQQKYTLNNVMFWAPDQLRQRVAWTLSNFLVISQENIGLSFQSEAFLSFWDIFTRHAFGSFLDIIRDISWHPLMARYLTYDRSRSYAASSTGSFPDENYARELMQLFTIGLYRMDDQGRYERDARGRPVETYGNEDIVDYSRVWTGLRRQGDRLNLADESRGSYVDPLELVPSWHDRFPKAKLDKGHIGDGYPLCDELPPRPWLRPGARFEFTGSTSVEGSDIDSANSTEPAGRRGRFTPSWDGNSALYNTLCAPATVGGVCTYPLTVTLDRTLPCYGEPECDAHSVRAVAIYDPVNNITQFYRYFGRPCVRLTLFDNGKELYRTWSRQQCGNPDNVRGVPACCPPDDLDRIGTSFGPECLFAAETMTYAQAEARCQAQNLTTCTQPRGQLDWEESCGLNMYAWTDVDCATQIQIYPNGRIGIVDPAMTIGVLLPNSFNYFRARWNNGRAPTAVGSTCPADAPCEAITTVTETSCVCNFTVSESVPFPTIESFKGVSVEAVAEQLHIGAVDPTHFDDGDYSLCSNGLCTVLAAKGIKVWLHSSDTAPELSVHTVIELPPANKGRPVRFLRNRLSVVRIGESFSFRNPPNFIPLVGFADTASRDYDSVDLFDRKIEHEIDALLVHLFEHQNTAPFVAQHMIQNMVTSNPSPRYVRAVARAFRTGRVGDVVFSDAYGDMGAMVYALLTDREARSPVVLADKHAGMVMDPLVKVMMVLRGLQYESSRGREILLGLETTGVQAFTSPSVFNFYSPFYQPSNAAGYGLVAPQAELLTTPNMIAMLNGLYSLVDNGLTPCYDGIGIYTHNESRCSGGRDGVRAKADGALTFMPNATDAADVVDELSLILTQGRVLPGTPTREVLISEYERVLAEGGSAEDAYKLVAKLLLTSAEFHTTMSGVPTERERESAAVIEPQGRAIKSIVMVFLQGGADSFNMLVPLDECSGVDLFQEYTSVRDFVAVPADQLLNVSATGTGQPCEVFGMHNSMSALHQLYLDGDLAWFANIGGLVESMDAVEYKEGGKQRPPNLFSHNKMQQAARSVHAQSTLPLGVLGRAADALTARRSPYDVRMASISGVTQALTGTAVAYDILSNRGSVELLRDADEIEPALANMTTPFASESVFAETYTSELLGAISSAKAQKAILDSAQLETAEWGDTSLTRQLQTAARLIKGRAASGTERVAVYASKGGWDTHGEADLTDLIDDVDDSIAGLVQELKAQGRWDSTVVMVVSEFGRTLRGNAGGGTDHGWGTHAFLLGGAVRGGRVLGEYPDRLAGGEGKYDVDQKGRILPSMPWEGMWAGVLEWFGVSRADLDTVLPNLDRFPASQVYDRADLFE